MTRGRLSVPTLAVALTLGCDDQLAYLPTEFDPPAIPSSSSSRAQPINLDDRPGRCPANPSLLSASECVAGTTCEYGASPDLRCNELYSCTDLRGPATSTRWAARARRSCSPCPEPRSIFLIAGAPCAIEVGPNAAASAEDEGICPMTDGVCACTTGADDETSHARRWICARPWGASCPEQRPRIGSPCEHRASCDYGSCSFKHGVSMVCVAGAWQVDTSGCP